MSFLFNNKKNTAFHFFLFTLFFLVANINFSNAQDIEQEIKTLDSLGQIYWKKAAYYKAMSVYKKALPLAEQIKNQKLQARILNYLGVIAENKGDMNQSFQYHFKALKIREKVNDNLIIQSYVNIGITYNTSGETKKALEYYFKALEINRLIKDKRLTAHAFYHISTSYKLLRDYEQATIYANKALAMAKEIKEKVIIIDAQNGLGLIAYEQKDYQKARDYYQKVYELATNTEDWLILTNNLLHFAQSYQQTKEYAQATEYAQKSLLLAQKYSLKIEEKNACDMLSTLYAQQYQYESAYQYHLKANILKDTIFNIQKNQQINELTIQYESEKKKQRIEILEKEKIIIQNTNYILIFGVITLIILLSFGFYRYKIRQKIQKQQQKIARIENIALEQKIILQETQKKLEQERFEEEIAHKERELTSTALHIFQKNEMLNSLQEKLTHLDINLKQQIKPLFEEIRHNLDLDKDWASFQLHFVKVHPDFFEKLERDFSSLSQYDCKLLAYIRMKLSNKEISLLLNITNKSVEMARYRLKKKFNLGTEDNLDKWLEKY